MEQWEIDAELDASESRFIEEIENEWKENEFIPVDREKGTLKMDFWKDSTGKHMGRRRW